MVDVVALARVAELEKRVAGLETENGLRCAQLAMLGSEVCGDPKLDPDDSGDPRWTPALREARALRERAQRAEARVAELERRQPYHELVNPGAVMSDDAHEWTPHKRDGWTVCSKCGLVRNYELETPCRGRLPPIALREGETEER